MLSANKSVTETLSAFANRTSVLNVGSYCPSSSRVTTLCEVGNSQALIVVGSHGRKELSRFLLSSVSHGIVHRAGCSVLVVR